MMIKAEEGVRSFEHWLRSPEGIYTDQRERKLMLDLLAPQEGERLLDVGCMTGHYLFSFKRAGCDVTGLDPTLQMLKKSREILNNRGELRRGRSEDLPFSDNEFDIVTLIFALEFSDDPLKAIEEAVRVSGKRIFIGFSNSHSAAGGKRRIRACFGEKLSSQARTFGVLEIMKMIRRTLPGVPLRWGSVIYTPPEWRTLTGFVEERVPLLKNPLGSFVGMVFPVKYSHRTIQDIIKDPLKMGMDEETQAQGSMKETPR